MKETIKTFLPFVLGVIIIILLFKDCGSSEKPNSHKEPDTKNVSLNEDSVHKWIKLVGNINKERILLKHNTDSLQKVNKVHKANLANLRAVNRKLIQLHPCDTTQSLQAYDNANLACDSIIHNDSLIIDSKNNELGACDSSNLVLSKVVIKQSEIISEVQDHDNWQKNVNDVLKKEVKKHKRTKIAVIVGAICAIVGTVFLLH